MITFASFEAQFFNTKTYLGHKFTAVWYLVTCKTTG